MNWQVCTLNHKQQPDITNLLSDKIIRLLLLSNFGANNLNTKRALVKSHFIWHRKLVFFIVNQLAIHTFFRSFLTIL